MKEINQPSIQDLNLGGNSNAHSLTQNYKKDVEPLKVCKLWKINEKYDIQGKLGQGGGGTVFSGVNRSNGQLVAIKVLKKSKVKRWLTISKKLLPLEIHLHQRACKRNIGVIELLEWYEEKNYFIIVMERIEPAVDLFDYLGENTIPEQQVVLIARQLVNSVSIFNSRGIIHRDLKDENIIINPSNLTIKIIDFGCATISQKKKFKSFSGTKAYYPPEWFRSHRYDGELLEVWTIGVLLYRMLTADEVSEINNNKFYWKENAENKLKLFSNRCQDIFSRILFCDETKRMSLKELCNHPWLK